MKTTASLRISLLLSLALTACSNLLPSGETSTDGPWQSYADAQRAFDQIVPYQTSFADLQRFGLDPRANPNITVLNYSDVIRRFIPSPSVSQWNLDQGVLDCIRAKADCVGFEIDKKVVQRKRTGNVVADAFNFERKTDTVGWRFNGIILLKNGFVVYKLTGGQPFIHENEKSRNPLGPFQNGLGIK